MKILLLNSVYREGSTGKIVASIGDTLRAQGHEVLTCYGIGASHVDEYSQKVCTNFEHNANALLSRITGIPYGGLFLSNCRIKKVIKLFQPDVVHIHCVNASTMNVYSLLKFLSQTGIKTVLTLHAEIFHTAGCSHAYDCNKWIDGCYACEFYRQRVYSWFFDRSQKSYRLMYDIINSFSPEHLFITAVSPWLADRAKQSAIMKRYPVLYVPNGVDTGVFHYTANNQIIDREGYEKIIIFVTPYFGLEEADIKGGRHLPEIASLCPDYKFVVVCSSQSKEIGQLPSNIQVRGRAGSQQELATLYSEADITLLLSQRETFSMVTAESLCCGTPVVGFVAGGPESIAIKGACSFSEYGNIKNLVKSIYDILHKNMQKATLSQRAAEYYSSEVSSNIYLSIYQKIDYK